MTKRVAGAVVLGWLTAASPSAAIEATPFELADPGEKPSVAVDERGAAHFAWNLSRTGEPDVTEYCKVLPGSTRCRLRRRFAPPGSDPTNNADPDGPRILVDGRLVVVVTHRCCGGFGPSPTDGLFARASNNRGRTFGSPQLLGNSSTAGDAIGGPGSTGFSTISDDVAGGTFFQTHRPGAFARESANLGDADPAQSNSGSLALVDDNTPFATFDDQITTFWRMYSGTGAYNDVASWTPTATVGPGAEGRLAYGPNGIWLLYRTIGPGGATFVAREFTGAGFGSPIEVSETGDPTFPDYFQDSAGRLHAVWLSANGALMYRRSDDGASYGRTTQLIGASSSTIANLEVAAGEDGNGWLVWDEDGSRVRAAALHVDPDPPVIGETVTVKIVKGEVLIKLPGKAAHASDKGSEFVPISVVRSIPVGSVVDTTEGKVKISSRRKKGGKKQKGTFSEGLFKVLQSRKAKAKGLTELKLKGSIAEHCEGGKDQDEAKANAALSRRAIRRLRARARGRYRTSGRYSAATVRGTKWTITDRCDGTLTKVKRGKVVVRDFRLKKNIVVKRGKRYLAKKRG